MAHGKVSTVLILHSRYVLDLALIVVAYRTVITYSPLRLLQNPSFSMQLLSSKVSQFKLTLLRVHLHEQRWTLERFCHHTMHHTRLDLWSRFT